MTNRRCSSCLCYSVLLAALVPLISSAEQTESESNIRFLIYVTNEVSGDVSVIDGFDRKVIKWRFRARTNPPIRFVDT
jgi:hypothetical protein